jgi:hypothetical protein
MIKLEHLVVITVDASDEGVVKDDIRKLWYSMELGNDHYYYRLDEDFQEECEEFYPNLVKYLKDNKVKDCLIHYWW